MPTLQQDRPTADTATKRRFWMPGLSEDPDRRSIQVGLIWTILIHLLLLLLAPEILRTEFSPGRFVRPGTTAKTYEIELTPESMYATPPKPMRFVETNPDANNNVPDKTDNFGAQNQQAAQPVPDKQNSPDHMPKTEGKKDFQNSTQVVTGSLQKPEAPQPTPPPQQEQKATTAQTSTQPKLQVPPQGYIKSSGDNPDAYGTEAVKLPEQSTSADKYVEGDKNSTTLTGTGAKSAAEVKQHPLPRPRLTQVRPGILQERPLGVTNAGTIAVDAHFSQFGDYLQELINIVQVEWENVLAGNAYPPSETHVSITFRINSQGRIAEILKVDGNAGDYGTNAALAAIRDREPYRPWTKEMVAVLGDSQDITFTFFYW